MANTQQRIIAATVDQLGEAEMQIAKLKRRAQELRRAVSSFGVGYHRGAKYQAAVAAIIDARGGVQVTVARHGS